MERRESEASRRDASQTLFPKHRLIEFMFLFMSLCLPTSLLSSHPHTDADTHVHPHTHQPSIPVDISSAPADSALSGPHSLSQSRTNEKKKKENPFCVFDQQTAAFLSYSLSLLCSSCSHQLTLMISSHYWHKHTNTLTQNRPTAMKSFLIFIYCFVFCLQFFVGKISL